MDKPSTSDNVATLSINAVRNGRTTTAPFHECFRKTPNLYFQTDCFLIDTESDGKNLDLPWENIDVGKKNKINLERKISCISSTVNNLIQMNYN